MQHPLDEELSAYGDGDLPPARADEVRAHLAACGACRDVVSELGAQRLALARLSDCTPPLAVWSRIAAARSGERPRRWRWAWLFPVGAVATAAVTLALFLRTTGPEAPVDPLRPQQALQAVARAEGLYRKAIGALQHAVEKEGSSLGPKVGAALQAGLAEVDRAIAKCRKMLRGAPGNADAQEAMLAAYQRKVDLLMEIVLRDPM